MYTKVLRILDEVDKRKHACGGPSIMKVERGFEDATSQRYKYRVS